MQTTNALKTYPLIVLIVGIGNTGGKLNGKFI